MYTQHMGVVAFFLRRFFSTHLVYLLPIFQTRQKPEDTVYPGHS